MSEEQIDMFGGSPATPPTHYRPDLPSIGRQKTVARTREKLIGVSGKTLAARTMRTVNSMRAQCTGIGMAFEDVDMTVVSAGEQLMAAFEEFEQAVRESVEWLKSEANY